MLRDGSASKENRLRKSLTAACVLGWDVTAWAGDVSVPSPGVAFWQSDGRSIPQLLSLAFEVFIFSDLRQCGICLTQRCVGRRSVLSM